MVKTADVFNETRKLGSLGKSTLRFHVAHLLLAAKEVEQITLVDGEYVKCYVFERDLRQTRGTVFHR